MVCATKQRGLSMTSFLFWGILLALLALVGFRIVPAYVEYFEVKRTMLRSIEEYDGVNASRIRSSFENKASAGYIDTVHGSDIVFSREGGHLVMSATWAKKLPLVANMSLVLDFDVTVQK